jgi:uncharacterized protein
MQASSMAYAAAVLLAWQTTRGRRWLLPLAASGRMALTVYLTQSLICTLIFAGYGLGLSGQPSWAGMLVLTFALYGVMMAGSVWWLKRHEFGPVEWLWRRATYSHGSTPKPIAPVSVEVA